MEEDAHGRKGRPKARPETTAVVPSERCEPVNKSAEIRKAARAFVSKGMPPRPMDIVAKLRKAGIEVTSAQVSTALAGTEFAFRRNREEWVRPRPLFPEPTLALSQVSIEDVLEARKFVERLGSLERAMAALVALGQFGGEQPRVDAPRPVEDDCRVVPERKPKPKASDEAAES